jgi:alpha-N-arabinofuranosidase
MTAAEYAEKFRQYAVYFKRLGLTTDLELVGVGHTAVDWNRVFLETVGAGLPYLDHLSVHRYFRRGNSSDFSDGDYAELMLDVSDFENTIKDAIRDIDAVEHRRAKMPVFGPLKPKPIGLAIDEWGVWHSDARLEDGFRQNSVLRDAIFAASCLNLFHRYATRITMTNIAQVVDCLHSLILTDDEAIVLTPTFYVYELYQRHRGAMALQVDQTTAHTISHGSRSQPCLSVSASQTDDAVFLTMVNQDPRKELDAVVAFRGAKPVSATATVLGGEGVRVGNTRDNPDAVVPKQWNAEVDDVVLRVRLPSGSIVAANVSMRFT